MLRQVVPNTHNLYSAMPIHSKTISYGKKLYKNLKIITVLWHAIIKKGNQFNFIKENWPDNDIIS